MKNAACRVAFAAFLHDLGELAERARMEVADDASHTRQPHDGHYINHPEAPPNDHTTLAWDTLKQHLPDLVRDELPPSPHARRHSTARTPSCKGSSLPPTASPPALNVTPSAKTTRRTTTAPAC